MVLFTEPETLLLLDLYLRLRERPQNVASNGVLLKAAARNELTRAVNKAGPREHSLTESQVFVKFKNLRNDYALVKWLEEQPGFKRNSEKLTEEWWADIKAKRPKAHVFKGKLPWPFYQKMAMILLDAPYVQVSDLQTARRLTELLGDDGGIKAAQEPGVVELTSESTGDEELPSIATAAVEPKPASSIINDSISTPLTTATTTQKRAREAENRQVAPKRKNPSTERTPSPQEELRSFERRESLAMSVEQCSVAAAAMARGFQDLVLVFQDQAEKCRCVVEAGEPEEVVRAENSMLLSIAKSLEHTTQTTADMAKGYRGLVQQFIQTAVTKRATL